MADARHRLRRCGTTIKTKTSASTPRGHSPPSHPLYDNTKQLEGRARGQARAEDSRRRAASGSSIAAILKHLGAKVSSRPAHPHPCRRSSSGLCQSRHPRLVVVGERALGPGLLRGAVPTRTRRHPRDRCLAWTHRSHAPHPHPHPTAASIHRPPSGPRPRSIRHPSALRRTLCSLLPSTRRAPLPVVRRASRDVAGCPWARSPILTVNKPVHAHMHAGRDHGGRDGRLEVLAVLWRQGEHDRSQRRCVCATECARPDRADLLTASIPRSLSLARSRLPPLQRTSSRRSSSTTRGGTWPRATGAGASSCLSATRRCVPRCQGRRTLRLWTTAHALTGRRGWVLLERNGTGRAAEAGMSVQVLDRVPEPRARV